MKWKNDIVLAALSWALVAAVLLLTPAITCGQSCQNGRCPMPQTATGPRLETIEQTGYMRSAVRIWNRESARATSGGSGCWIEYAGYEWIVTCSHLFREGVGQVIVQNADGTTVHARLIVQDPVYDVAVLIAKSPGSTIPRVKLAEELPQPGQELLSVGYGQPSQRFAINRGRFQQFVMPSTSAEAADWIEMSGAARQGDSGGPIYTSDGRLCGVLFGTNGRIVNGVAVGRLRLVLDLAMRTLKLVRRTSVQVIVDAPRVGARVAVGRPVPVYRHHVEPLPPRAERHKRVEIEKRKTISVREGAYRHLATLDDTGWRPSGGYQPQRAVRPPTPARPLVPVVMPPLVPIPDPNFDLMPGPEPCPNGDCAAASQKPLLPWRGKAEQQDAAQDGRIDRMIGLLERDQAARAAQPSVVELPKPKPEVAPESGEPSPLLVGLCIVGSVVLGFVIYFAGASKS